LRSPISGEENACRRWFVARAKTFRVDRKLGYGMRLDPVVDRLVRRWLPEIPLLVAITHSMADEYRALDVPDERIVAIPNGVNVARFRRGAEPRAVRRRHGLPEHVVLFLSVARNHPKKNLAAIIEAAAPLASRGGLVDWAVAIVGKDAPKLRPVAHANRVAERVYLIDEIGQGDDGELRATPLSSFIAVPMFSYFHPSLRLRAAGHVFNAHHRLHGEGNPAIVPAGAARRGDARRISRQWTTAE
jgi:glycosyltransferase involved in cell wall biosynthesis